MAILLLLDLGDGRLEIFEGKLPVVLVEPLGPLAVHDMVQLGDQVFEALDDLLKGGRLVPEDAVLAQQRGDGVALVRGEEAASAGTDEAG